MKKRVWLVSGIVIGTLLLGACSKEEVIKDKIEKEEVKKEEVKKEMLIEEVKVYALIGGDMGIYGEALRSGNEQLLADFYQAIQNHQDADPKADAILDGEFYEIEFYKGTELEMEKYEMWINGENVTLQYDENGTTKYVKVEEESELVIRQFINNMRD